MRMKPLTMDQLQMKTNCANCIIKDVRHGLIQNKLELIPNEPILLPSVGFKIH